jgi:hypothetical protein
MIAFCFVPALFIPRIDGTPPGMAVTTAAICSGGGATFCGPCG